MGVKGKRENNEKRDTRFYKNGIFLKCFRNTSVMPRQWLYS